MFIFKFLMLHNRDGLVGVVKERRYRHNKDELVGEVIERRSCQSSHKIVNGFTAESFKPITIGL